MMDVSEVIVRRRSSDRKINTEKGQAVFEFLVFLPFLILLYILSVTVNGAINASINQEKITRGYLYARMKNNSTYPPPVLLISSVNRAGMYFLGWREKVFGDDYPVAPCFQIPVFGEATNKDTCIKGGSETTTGFIRVETAYGVCGATWERDPGGLGSVLSVEPASRSSCEYR